MLKKGQTRERLGRLIRKKRQAANYTQQELAEVAGVSQATVSNAEQGSPLVGPWALTSILLAIFPSCTGDLIEYIVESILLEE